MFPWLPFLKDTGDTGDLPDHFVGLPYFDGRSATAFTSGGVQLGVNNEDTVKMIIHTAAIAEAGVNSIHEEDNATSYQNTSGADAFAILILKCDNTGAIERHIKLHSSPNDNSTTSATLLFEVGAGTANSILDADNEELTVGPLRISNNHYLVIENVDDSRAGSNDIRVSVPGWVVERG